MQRYEDTGSHALWDVIEKTERTHPGLGRLVAVQLVSAKAHMVILAVSPAGCGKSVVGRAIGRAVHKRMQFDSLTRSGLVKLQEAFTNYEGVIIIDDMGKVDSDYSRISTMTTLVELVYTHYVSKHSANIHLDIHDFNGTAILNCQPVVMQGVVKSSEWEATIQDKCLRYYHFYRPLEPSTAEIEVEPLPDATIEECEHTDKFLPGYAELREIGTVQWSRGRVDSHIDNLLRSCAIIDHRDYVNADDVRLLTYLLQPMKAERYIMRKEELEGERAIDNTLTCFFVEWASHGAFTLDDLCMDYHITVATAYRILDKYKRFWLPIESEGQPKRFAPSHLSFSTDGKLNMVDVLHDIGINYQQFAE